ncbi:MAG: ABC-F family ATP-binding cassette domain-containing protein [Thermoflexaceae bacterium]|nr:ABC-F family ATP-binding cassette domain-containing protein [Thermoflexaceae bacterium]
MLRISAVSKELGGRPVLRDVTFTVNDGEPAALAGPNGAGKTTLLRIIAGELAADAGAVQAGRGASIGFLAQGYAGREGEPVAAAFPALAAARGGGARLEALAEALAASPGDVVIAAEYDRQLALVAEGAPAEEAERLAAELGLLMPPLDTPLGTLSGGELTKLGLIDVLLRRPGILLLDEPTNHLDLDGIERVERLIAGFPGPVLFVSHDRALMDAVAAVIIELDPARAGVETFAGGYSGFAGEKARREADQWERYGRQQREERRLKQVISGIESSSRATENSTINFAIRKKAAKVARRAVTLKARMERELESVEHVARPDTRMRGIEGSFGAAAAGASRLVTAEGVALAPGGRMLVEGLTFAVDRGQRLAVTGPNGVGKTTLLRAILGEGAVAAGELTLAASAKVGYLAQDEGREMGEEQARRTPVELLRRAVPMTEREASNALHRFLLGHTSPRTPAGALSYGERRRLSLALLILGGANLLLLDEPTNHLDLPSREAFERALAGFAGAVVAVTHDRRFIRELGCEVLDLGAYAAVMTAR